MNIRDAKKLHNGDEVEHGGVVCKVLSVGPVVERVGAPPVLTIRILGNGGHGPFIETTHLEVR